jgi:hypothetical protein
VRTWQPAGWQAEEQQTAEAAAPAPAPAAAQPICAGHARTVLGTWQASPWTASAQVRYVAATAACCVDGAD